jgi:hypothetical protein
LITSLVAAASAASAACSLLVDLDGLTGGGAVDAATAPDASVDSTASDAPLPPVDSSAIDAGPDAFDAGPFCMRAKHDFCTDFDQTTNVATGWEAAYPYPGDAGNAELDLMAFTSPPASGLVRCFAQPINRGFILETNVLRKAVAAVHFSIDARFDTDTSGGVLIPLALSFTNGALPEYEFSLIVRGADKVDIEQHPNADGGAYESTRLSVGVKMGTWAHFDGDVFFTSPPHAVVRVDGVQAVDEPLRTYAHAGALNVQAGMVYTTLQTETRMHLDNVSIDVQ